MNAGHKKTCSTTSTGSKIVLELDDKQFLESFYKFPIAVAGHCCFVIYICHESYRRECQPGEISQVARTGALESPVGHTSMDSSSLAVKAVKRIDF